MEADCSLCRLVLISHIKDFFAPLGRAVVCSSIAHGAVPERDACHGSPQDLSIAPHPLFGTLQLQPLFVRLGPLNMQLQQRQTFGHEQGPGNCLPKTWAHAAGGPGRRGQAGQPEDSSRVARRQAAFQHPRAWPVPLVPPVLWTERDSLSS